MDELETRLLNLPLKEPSADLDVKVLAGANNLPHTQDRPRRLSRFYKNWSLAKTAAAIATALMLVGVGWAGERVYKKVASLWLQLEKPAVQEWTLPDGRKMTTCEVTATTVNSGNPKAVETAKHHHEEMKQLLRQRKYELIKTFDVSGEKQYLYRFTFADGSRDTQNFAMPLDGVSSWEDYQQKSKALRQQRQEQVSKAIAAGKFCMLDVNVTCVHICRDAATGQKLRVQRISVSGLQHIRAAAQTDKEPDSQNDATAGDIALARPFNEETPAVTTMQTSWRDHLDAIRNGSRLLLSLETVPSYTYEVTLADGSTTIFSYGGEPLQKPEATKDSHK